MKILNNVNSPEDIKKLSPEEMNKLSEEIREAILNRVNTIGGHLGPDLGIVEATIALHYVFNSPKDKIVFDVSHQIYPHKIITGRKDGFLHPENTTISGYSNPNESEHDNFIIGHTSTAASLATGLAKARDLKGENYNVIAIVGDGSLSGGEAFEGFNNASVLDSNIILVVNDNEMSIAETQGGLYKNLKALRDSNGKSENNIFKALGFDYLYVDNGNDIETLIKAFMEVKDTNHPTVVHIHTLKGKGYKQAEENKEKYHWTVPGFMDKSSQQQEQAESYESLTTEYLLKKHEEDSTLIAISPSTPGAYGFTPEFRQKMGKNYTDPGIAEEHAVAYASALAKNGAKPVLAVISSFIQRTYDQLSQDLALNNSPATILVYWGGLSPMDSTHVGSFDIPMISNIPNIVYLAPTTKEEYLRMLDWSIEQKDYSVAIRVPFASFVTTGIEDKTDYSILNKSKIVKRGSKIAVIALGDFFKLGLETVEQIKEKLGVDATLINPVYITGLDKELLESLKKDHDIVVTLENGVLDGGYGEKISRFYGNSDMKVLNFGGKKEFTDRLPLAEQFVRYHLTKELIVEDISKVL